MNVKAVLTVMIMMLGACVGMVAVSSGSDAAVSTAEYSLSGDELFATDSSEEFELLFKENTPTDSLEITYVAVLVHDGSTVVSGVSPSSGTLTNGEKTTLTVASQSDAGNYTLEVTITESVQFTGDTYSSELTYTVSKSLRIVEPITLSVTLKNDGSTDLYKGTVVFYLDGNKIEGSEQEVSVSAGEETTVTYDYVPDNLSHGSHTYYVVGANGTEISGIGPDHKATFYYHQSTYDYLIYIAVILIIIMLIVIVWMARKPTVTRGKNLGKPKSRKDKA